ncbi:uncharacterized protein LOC128243914 [Mya arenaria]|uniref:uncharacterized protein LOC128243914 n=1 Tax=Mya arenaria TaxID=6604 RepID=UPI0022E31B91|nr:uncharacterized protein LOC128243914 [Mya arenaria]
MTRNTFLCLVVTCMDIVTHMVNTAPTLPRKGLSLCDLHITASQERVLKCAVKAGEVMDYREVRTWSASEQNANYSIQIICNGGAIHLPWPFKAQNIHSLEVDGCKVQGFLSEMTMVQTLPDQLRTLALTRSTIVIPFSEMFQLRNNLNMIPRETDCGQNTLESLVLRDVHYDLIMSPEERDKMPGLLTDSHSRRKHEVKKTPCVYPHLRYVDESGSRKTGQYHLKLLPEYSRFPKLEVYNMSRNELSHVPDFFRHLHSEKFPSLKHLDFSNNILHSFEFEFPKNLKACSLKVVDLHNNRIATIPQEATDKLKSIGTILVDMRENPLRCSCQLTEFRNYLETQYTMTTNLAHRKLVSDVTCTLSPIFHDNTLKVSVLDSTFDKKCKG